MMKAPINVHMMEIVRILFNMIRHPIIGNQLLRENQSKDLLLKEIKVKDL